MRQSADIAWDTYRPWCSCHVVFIELTDTHWNCTSQDVVRICDSKIAAHTTFVQDTRDAAALLEPLSSAAAVVCTTGVPAFGISGQQGTQERAPVGGPQERAPVGVNQIVLGHVYTCVYCILL